MQRSTPRAFVTLVAVAAIALVAAPSQAQTGENALFIGHSFFRPFADAMPFHAAQAGIVGHTQSVIFSGGATGAPQALWEDPDKGPQIRGLLDAADVDLFGMTYHSDYPTSIGYENWITYALAQNPSTRFALALPWATNPGTTSANEYATTWTAGHDTGWHALIDHLRDHYPGVEIFCIPYGQSAPDLRLLFDAGALPDVDFLVSATGDAIYRDAFGHADDVLIDLGALVWLNVIYEVDLSTYAHDPGYTTDLKAIAQSIRDDHDGFLTRAVPSIPPGGLALLATLVLTGGAWALRARRTPA